MLQSVNDFLVSFVNNVRVADLLDIVLVSTFLFVLISWVQRCTTRSTSRSLFAVASIFAIIYVLARFFEMYLVESVIEVVSVILLFSTIVVFQSDIRQMAERIGTWRRSDRSSTNSSNTPVDLLTEATTIMATEQTGALIAIKGRESWEHLTQGGIELRGTVSKPLLQSLFNPNAPGHDGAVLLEGDRIVKFAAHLPLSTRLPSKSEPGGTRHSAALGLSEQCDAIVIVVSEESGSISVAHRGRLSTLPGTRDVKGVLEAFWQQHYNAHREPRPAWWRRRVPQTAFLCFVLATLFWYLFAYHPDVVYRMFDVPIEMRDLPPRWRLVDPAPTQAQVTLTGSEIAFQSLDPSTLAITVDLDNIEAGANEFVLGADDLALPSGLELHQVEPSTMQIRAARLQPVRVPVQVRTIGALPDTLRLADVQATPDSLTLLVPPGADAPDVVLTQPVDLSTITPSSSSVQAELELPPRAQLPSGQSSAVSVDVRVESE